MEKLNLKDTLEKIYNIRKAYYYSQRNYHNYTEWGEEEWNRIDKAEREAIDAVTKLYEILETTKET